jgi:hypothetical protein
MGRIEFNDMKQADKWIKDIAINGGKDYHGYYTSHNELILVPGKSTRPVIYGYIKFVKKDDLVEIHDSLNIYTCDTFEWNAERGLYKE